MSSALSAFRGSRLPRPVRDSVTVERYRGYVSAERVQVLAKVAQVAMWSVAELSAYEAQLSYEIPNAAPRLRVIGDVAAAAIATEVTRLGFGQ